MFISFLVLFVCLLAYLVFSVGFFFLFLFFADLFDSFCYVVFVCFYVLLLFLLVVVGLLCFEFFSYFLFFFGGGGGGGEVWGRFFSSRGTLTKYAVIVKWEESDIISL